jgi:hypothetical protein
LFASKCLSTTAALALLLGLASPALAQERTDEPTGDDPTDGPHRTESPPGRDFGHAPPASTPAPPPPPAAQDRAPWAWPWGGPRSPEWTQDQNWANTHFWVEDVGHVELSLRYEADLARRTYNVDSYFEAQARIGILPHIELYIGEDATLLYGDHVRQEGNEIGARVSIWDYGTIPLNPAIEVIWKPRHNGPDAYEGRGTLGFELFPGLLLAGNAFFQGETGGSHDYTWGFRGGAAYELIHDTLRVGAEGGVSWAFNPDNKAGPFRNTSPTVGPTVLFRPLQLVKPAWGSRLKITGSCEFGVRDDDKSLPFLKGALVVACEF